MEEVKIEERGWAGHCCVSNDCLFRRNTLITLGDRRIVVSTVGNLIDGSMIGSDRYYETMAFEAHYSNGYWEADVNEQIIAPDCEDSLSQTGWQADRLANEMHDDIVNIISKRIEMLVV